MYLEEFISTSQVTKYSTFLGQLWYVLVFIFRLIVVVTIGGSVYGDEQSAFQCSTDVVGCTNICYNEFAKMSHLRFWSFQLLAVATPTVMFHFYTLYASAEIEKLKKAEKNLEAMEKGDVLESGDAKIEIDFRKMSRRKKSVGNIKHRQIYSGSELKDVPVTNKIHFAYYFSVTFRLVTEAVFIYLGYQLYMNMYPHCKSKPNDPACSQSNNPFYFMWMKVPATYRCIGDEGSDVHAACYIHVRHGGHVPCFVSRPYEKTVLLCYMSVLSGICFLLSALELIIIPARHYWKRRHPKQKHLQHHPTNRLRMESVFHQPSTPSAPNQGYDDRPYVRYPSLGVPVRIKRYNNTKHNSNSKVVRISDDERNSEKVIEKDDYFSDDK